MPNDNVGWCWPHCSQGAEDMVPSPPLVSHCSEVIPRVDLRMSPDPPVAQMDKVHTSGIQIPTRILQAGRPKQMTRVGEKEERSLSCPCFPTHHGLHRWGEEEDVIPPSAPHFPQREQRESGAQSNPPRVFNSKYKVKSGIDHVKLPVTYGSVDATWFHLTWQHGPRFLKMRVCDWVVYMLWKGQIPWLSVLRWQMGSSAGFC